MVGTSARAIPMFKKPLSGTKTSAPLRSSDRRKLKQRIVETYQLSDDDGDLLVPDGILSLKFSTHLDQHGVAYIASDGDPLWFTVGKDSTDLIPTVYTLWKHNDLLPTISTPAAVIPNLVGGADLMIPGVIHHSPSLQPHQLVSILQYNRDPEDPSLTPPLAVGRMAVPSETLSQGRTEKGKAVLVLHTWKDHLWHMGSKRDVPEAVQFNSDGNQAVHVSSPQPPTDDLSNLAIHPSEDAPTYTPQEITTLLNISLYQAISSAIPSSSFPIPATNFYTNHILPSRPAFPTSIISHSDPLPPDAPPSHTEITIKSSTHKSLTTFLKAAEKSGLLTLKSPQKHSQQTDLLVTSVNNKHPSVAGHVHHLSVKDVQNKAAKKATQEEKAKEAERKGEVQVTELWKPHQTTVGVFEAMGASTSDVYSLSEVKAALNSYIRDKSLVNPYEQAYINLDPILAACVSKSTTKSKGKDEPAEPVKFMKRDELIKALLDRMQPWHEVRVEGKESMKRKGAIAPIQVVTKTRQGRKACTLITGYEPFLVVDAEEMAEELRKACAGATSISPIQGKPANAGMEVLVQGRQSKVVVEYLSSKGIDKKWVHVIG